MIGAAIHVHRVLGPGLLESVYEHCLAHELRKCGFVVETQKPVPIRYDGLVIDGGFRLDLLVGTSLVVELKHVEALLPVHQAQLLTYLKLTGCQVGLLLNFNVPTLRRGIRRIVNDFPEK